jgi:hypothetical protein
MVEFSSMLKAYLFWNTRLPVNLLLFQMGRMPHEAPLDGTYSKESKVQGHIFFFM